MSKRFINSPTDVVPELMQGLSLDSSRVTLVDPSSGYSIAVRSSIATGTQTPRVSVVSGGGSGHEPMAAGYVGEGMLAGSVAGSIFASPSVPAIVTLFETVAPHSQGIVAVVMNYEGDKINFRMAVEEMKRRRPTFAVRVVLVGDDVSIPNSASPRGIAGTIFVLKVTGAAADQGRTFQEVVNIAETAARSVCSYGIALEPCTKPGQTVDRERLGEDEIELGMGIHGEPGADKARIPEPRGSLADYYIDLVCSRLDAALHARRELVNGCMALAIMVNNLGSVTQAEMLIICKAVADFIFNANGTVLNGKKYPVHMFSGSFITSLQMNGVSITAFMIPTDNGHMNQLLHSSTPVLAWNPGFQVASPARRQFIPVSSSTNPAPVPSAGNSMPARKPGISLSERTQKYITAMTSALLGYADELDEIDQRTGDSDFGSTVRNFCTRIQADLNQGHYNQAAGNPAFLFKLIAGSIGQAGGGTIGGITLIFLQAASQFFERSPPDIGLPLWRIAVVEGTRAVMEQGRAKVGDRTLVDALKPAADVLGTPGRTLAEAAWAAKIGYESTKSMTVAKFGRSAHVRGSMLLNYPDPGAYAVWIILDALLEASAGDT